MTDATLPTTAPRPASRALPLAVSAVLLCLAAIVASSLLPQRADVVDGVDPLPAGAFTDVEFLVQAAPVLDAALTRACAASGCDGDLVSTLVRAEAVAMTPEELAEAIRLQALAVVEADARLAAEGDAAPSEDALSEAAARHALLRFYVHLRDHRTGTGGTS